MQTKTFNKTTLIALPVIALGLGISGTVSTSQMQQKVADSSYGNVVLDKEGNTANSIKNKTRQEDTAFKQMQEILDGEKQGKITVKDAEVGWKAEVAKDGKTLGYYTVSTDKSSEGEFVEVGASLKDGEEFAKAKVSGYAGEVNANTVQTVVSDNLTVMERVQEASPTRISAKISELKEQDKQEVKKFKDNINFAIAVVIAATLGSLVYVMNSGLKKPFERKKTMKVGLAVSIVTVPTIIYGVYLLIEMASKGSILG